MGISSQPPDFRIIFHQEIEPDDLSGEDFVPYRKRWRTPQVAPEAVEKQQQFH